jgi:hypothetical protein
MKSLQLIVNSLSPEPVVQRDNSAGMIARLLRRPASVFLVFLAIYLTTWGGHYTTGDGGQKIAWAKSMLFHHSANIGSGPVAVYSRYGIGHSLIAIPPMAAAHWIRNLTGLHCEAALYTFLFLLNGAAFLYLVALYLMPIYGVGRTWITVGIMGLATSWWPYTKMDCSEVLVLTFLFWGFLLTKQNRPLLGMLVASMIVTLRPETAILVALLAAWRIWSTRNCRELPWLMLASAPAFVLDALSNYIRWGTIFSSGYPHESFSTPVLLGLYGILFSAGKSIFLFSPPLLLGVVATKRFLQTRHGRNDGWFFISVLVSQLVLYAAWWDWSGDDSWGVRFVLPGVMLMCIPVVEVLDFRNFVAVIATVGIAVQLLAVLIGGLDYILILHQYPLERQALYVDAPPQRVDVEDMRFNPRYSQLAGHWLLIRILLGFPPPVASHAHVMQTGTPLYDALRASGWPGNVYWDFIWLRHGRQLSPPEPAAKSAVWNHAREPQ